MVAEAERIVRQAQQRRDAEQLDWALDAFTLSAAFYIVGWTLWAQWAWRQSWCSPTE